MVLDFYEAFKNGTDIICSEKLILEFPAKKLLKNNIEWSISVQN